MIHAALVLHLLVAGTAPSGGSPATSHDVHVSHTRMVLEGRSVVLRIRLFHDDLQLALRRFGGDSTLALTMEHRADSLFGAYFRQGARLAADGRAIRLRVTSSGMERDDAAEQVVWYVLEGEVARPVAQLVLLQSVLFEVFRDQQNIVQLLRLPEDRRHTLYFTARDPREQALAP